MTIIKAGYRITVASWENDSDNYNTEIVDGLSKEEINFTVDFIKLFNSKNDNKNPGIGNMYDPDKEEINEANKRIKEVFVKHKKEWIEGKYESENWWDFAYDIGLTCGEFFTRVLDNYKVEYIPQDIELEDVTKEFA